jgi:hypothetical protein
MTDAESSLVKAPNSKKALFRGAAAALRLGKYKRSLHLATQLLGLDKEVCAGSVPVTCGHTAVALVSQYGRLVSPRAARPAPVTLETPVCQDAAARGIQQRARLLQAYLAEKEGAGVPAVRHLVSRLIDDDDGDEGGGLVDDEANVCTLLQRLEQVGNHRTHSKKDGGPRTPPTAACAFCLSTRSRNAATSGGRRPFVYLNGSRNAGVWQGCSIRPSVSSDPETW